MSFDWAELLRLPEATMAGGLNIPKTMLVKNGELTKSDQRRLSNVLHLKYAASLKHGNTRIPPVVNGEYDAQSVLILACELKTTASAPAEVMQVIHKVFPNPTVVCAETSDGRIGISVGLKRRSQSEAGEFVVESIRNSSFFSPDDERYEPYLSRIQFPNLSQQDLLSLVRKLASDTERARVIPVLGFYPACGERDTETLMRLVREVSARQVKIEGLRARWRAKGVSLAESAKLRVQMRDMQREIDEYHDEIQRLCR